MNGRRMLAITMGEPAGIGPEIVARLAQRHAERPLAARLVILGDHGLLVERAARIGLVPRYVAYDLRADAAPDGMIEVWDAAGKQWGRCGTDAAGAFSFVVAKPAPQAGVPWSANTG